MAVDHKTFDIEKAQAELSEIYWVKHNFKHQINDVIFCYVTSPISKIMYQFQVIGFAENSKRPTVQEKYWRDKKTLASYKGDYIILQKINRVDKDSLRISTLKAKGLISDDDTLQGRRNDNSSDEERLKLFDYIKEQFGQVLVNYDYPDEAETDTKTYPEAAKKTVIVNAYERNPAARAACLEYYKEARCQICTMNFEEIYGSFAKDFIHVHHVIPLSQLPENYQVNPKTDLIPVCPNCHAMLHRSEKGIPMSVDRLKLLIEVSANSNK